MILVIMFKDWREKKIGRSKVNRKFIVVQYRRNGGLVYGNNGRNGEKGMCFVFVLGSFIKKNVFQIVRDEIRIGILFLNGYLINLINELMEIKV